MRNITPIIKPTNNCNLRCKYCYVSDSKSEVRFIMPDSILEKTIKKILTYNDSEQGTDFIWHGGEPLLAGIGFFERAVDYQKSCQDSSKIHNSIQTNLTLLNGRALEFLVKNNFTVGTSIDGSETAHDMNRKTKSEGGTFSIVYENLKRAKDAGLKIGAVVTLNKHNLDEMGSLYNMFKELRVNFRINPVFFSTKKERMESDFSITSQNYGKAMTELFDLWFYDKNPTIEIETFDLILNNIVHKAHGDCSYSGDCQEGFLLVDPFGNVYPCDKFDGREEFKMGNIAEDEVGEILNADIRSKLKLRDVNKIEACEPCSYKSLCNAGCMYDAYTETGDFNDRSSFCEGDFIMFDHINKRVSQELEKARIK